MFLCEHVCLCLSVAASSTVPNFKSCVFTLIFSSPALRTQRKTEESRPGSLCHSHPSQRCLFLFLSLFVYMHFLYLSLSLSHLYTYPKTHTHRHTKVFKCLLCKHALHMLFGLVVTYSNSVIILSLAPTDTVTLHCKALAQ